MCPGRPLRAFCGKEFTFPVDKIPACCYILHVDEDVIRQSLGTMALVMSSFIIYYSIEKENVRWEDTPRKILFV